MSGEILSRLQARRLAALLVSGAFALASVTGCASKPSVMPELDRLIQSGILDKPALTYEERGKVKAALIGARSEIIAATLEKEKAEDQSKSSAEWATRGKAFALSGIMCLLLVIVGCLLRFFLFR